MESDMSFLGLIGAASALVQFVMLTLVAASIASWIMIYQRWSYYRSLQSSDRAFESDFWSGEDLSQLYARSREDSSRVLVGLEAIFVAGFKEFLL